MHPALVRWTIRLTIVALAVASTGTANALPDLLERHCLTTPCIPLP